MAPHDEVVTGGVPEGAIARCLAEPGRQYAVYMKGGTGAEVALEIPKGSYRLQWLNPRTGETEGTQTVDHPGGPLRLQSPSYVEDIALSLHEAR